ncbi:hypothetical protein [Sphingomonas cavernae]|uniref:hypothetical protein n=1 Tax=Sphingomonas cavernae TaxID=2320861 RepID=UPI001603F62C|nr:hypothetical protein [Sphingomonas cavernae]
MLDDTPMIWSLLIWATIALVCVLLGGPWWLLITLPLGCAVLLPWGLAIILAWAIAH